MLATRLMRRAKALGVRARRCRAAVRARTPSRSAHLDQEAALRAGDRARRRRRPPRRRCVKVLKRHQERLGHLHDLQMLLKHVRETEASPTRRVARERSDGVRRCARPRMPAAARRFRRAPRRDVVCRERRAPSDRACPHDATRGVRRMSPGRARPAVRPRRAKINADAAVRAVPDSPRRGGRAR